MNSPPQLQLSSKTDKRPSISQLCTQLSRNRCISWSLNAVLAVTTLVILLVASLDVMQAALCVHLLVFCITSAVLVWTKDSRNAFGLSVGAPVVHFVFLCFIIWNCEPVFLVLKLAFINLTVFSTRIMRITGVRLAHAIEQKPKSRVRVTIVQLLIGASLVLVASLYLAYPDNTVFSFAEIALWGCSIVDVLWHFGIWKMTMKRAFRDVQGMGKIVSRHRRNSSFKTIQGVKRRQYITVAVGIVFSEIVGCAFMIFSNPAFNLLSQDKSNECKQRKSSVGSQRIFAFVFSALLAVHIVFWVLIYTHVLKKRRDAYIIKKKESENRKILQGSYVNASMS
jgi:hypothetical protein